MSSNFNSSPHFSHRDYAKHANVKRMLSVTDKLDDSTRETVQKCDDVVVFKGRKVPVGTEGRVFWMGNNGWGMSVGIETLDGDRVFTALSNVQRK
jgi:hypothetical protein